MPSEELSGSPRLAVLTTVHRQPDQLLAQIGGISVGTRMPALHVVVGMSDPDLVRGRLPIGHDRWVTVVRSVQTNPRRLPVAAARNEAARAAAEAGAEVLAFLDADCIPGPRFLQTVLEHVVDHAHPRPVAWTGQLHPLPPPSMVGQPVRDLDQLAVRELAHRPQPGQEALDPRVELFCASAMAITTQDFQRTGGFCTDMFGVDGLDADFGQAVRSAGGTLVQVGGADAYRQHRSEGALSAERAELLVANANTFYDRWGWWPMGGQLGDLAEAGLARRDRESGRWLAG